MKTKVTFIFSAILVLALMEGVVWVVYKSSQKSQADFATTTPEIKTSEKVIAPTNSDTLPVDTKETRPVEKPDTPASYSGLSNIDPGSFPPPSVEEKNGRTERTIHIGVRQWVWEPATIRAKQGELVRLIVHNADVKHGLVIPDLGVNQDIPPEGAVIEFTASQKGTFQFFCSVYCGEGHMEMRGKIVIE